MDVLKAVLLTAATVVLVCLGLLDTELPLPRFLDRHRFEIHADTWRYRLCTNCFVAALICAFAAAFAFSAL
jgi:hypothetical protein